MYISNYLEIFQKVWIMDFLRYSIPASSAFLIFWVLLRKQLSKRFLHSKRPENRQMISEILYSMSTVIIFAIVGTGLALSSRHGWLNVYSNINELGWIYYCLSIAIVIVIHDTYFYWTHRWMHHPKIYKYVHHIHHQSINPTPWAAYSFHPLEALVQVFFFPIVLFTIPMHHTAAVLFLIYMILRNVMGHLGYELFPIRFVKNKLLNWHTTTTHHNMHHKYFNCNYGFYFSWWDHWMGTTHQKYGKEYEENIKTKKGAVS